MKYLSLIYILALSSCGSLTDLTSITSKLRVRMYGSTNTATSADGLETPDTLTVTVTGVTMHEVGATTNTDLLKDGTTEYKILTRPQAIYINDAMTDYEGKSYDAMTVTYKAAAKVVDRNGTSYDLTLTTPAQTLSIAFTIAKHENRQLTVKTSWGKTIKTDTTTGVVSALQPSFALTFDE